MGPKKYQEKKRMVHPDIAKKVRLQPKLLKAKMPLRHLARISQRGRESPKAKENEEVGVEEHRLLALETLRRSIDQKERKVMMRRIREARKPKMELPRAVTKRRKSLKSRKNLKILSTKTQWTSKRRRPSRISTKSGNLVTGRKARVRLSSRLRPSSHQFQPNSLPSLMNPLSWRKWLMLRTKLRKSMPVFNSRRTSSRKFST